MKKTELLKKQYSRTQVFKYKAIWLEREKLFEVLEKMFKSLSVKKQVEIIEQIDALNFYNKFIDI